MNRSSIAVLSVFLALGVFQHNVCALRLGGIEKATPDEDHIQHVANFAVQQLNENGENGAGELVLDRVLSARKQLVAGTLYFLTIQTLDGTNGTERKFEVAIYEPFGKHTNTLKLTHAKEARKVRRAEKPTAEAEEAAASTESQAVAVDDETVAEGAAYAVAQLTQQSNSLMPWVLKEVVSASAVTSNGSGKAFALTLAVVRGQEEKAVKVNVRQVDMDNWLLLGSFVITEPSATS